MPRIINDNCIMCGDCAAVCPVSCIEEGDPKYIIDPDSCIDCGACQDACNNEAIDEE